MACLDTSALIDLSGRDGAAPRKRIRDTLRALLQDGEQLVTTRFNVAELWVGVARSQDPEAEREKIETLLSPLPVLEFDARCAEVFGYTLAHLQERGLPIGDMDTLIASVSLVSGHGVITRNEKHFERIPGLTVVTY